MFANFLARTQEIIIIQRIFDSIPMKRKKYVKVVIPLHNKENNIEVNAKTKSFLMENTSLSYFPI